MTLIYYPDDARRTLVYPSVYPDGKTPNTPKTRVFCFFPLFFCVCSLLNKPTVPENGTHHTAAVVFYESEWLHTAIHRYTALYIIQLNIAIQYTSSTTPLCRRHRRRRAPSPSPQPPSSPPLLYLSTRPLVRRAHHTVVSAVGMHPDNASTGPDRHARMRNTALAFVFAFCIPISVYPLICTYHNDKSYEATCA